MNRISVLAAAIALAALSTYSAAQEEASETEVAQAAGEEAADEAERAAETAAPPPAAGDSEPADVFIPSEEIAADEEVTFPVDI